MMACYNVFDVHQSFVACDAVRQQLMRGYIPPSVYRKTFYDVQQPSEVDGFLSGWPGFEGPFTHVLWPVKSYDTAPLHEPERQYVLGGNARLLGGVEVRMVRVHNASCTGVGSLGGQGGQCWAPYSAAAAFTGTVPSPSTGEDYDYGSVADSELRGRYGGLRNLAEGNYGRNGYRVVLPAGDAAAAAAFAAQVRDDGVFYDPGLRAVGITINLYNTNSRLLTVVRLILEFPETGDILPSSICFAVPVPELFVTNTMDTIVIIIMVIYGMGFVYYMQKEARRWWHFRPRYLYFTSMENVFEVVQQMITLIFIVYYLVYLAQGIIIDVNNPAFHDYFDQAWHFTDTFMWGGFVGFMSSIKAFRYLSINKRMNTLWLMLARARQDLAAFGFSLLLCLLAFAFMGQQAFGYRLNSYKDFSSSMSTLLQYILGNFAYDELSDARPLIAWCFFGLYVIIVNIVVINLIIAIVSKYYEEVHEELRRVDKWKAPTSRLEQEMFARGMTAAVAAARGATTNLLCCVSARARARARDRKLCWCNACTTYGCCALYCSCIPAPARSCCVRRMPASKPAGASSPTPAAPVTSSAPGGSESVRIMNPMGAAAAATATATATAGGARRASSMRSSEEPEDVLAAAMSTGELEIEDLPAVMQSQQWASERRFWVALRHCSRTAKHNNHIHLFPYFERVYEDTVGSDSLYCSVHEMCSLVRTRPCNPTGHLDCEARALQNAYNDMKLVLMVGRVQQHKSTKDQLKENPARMFKCHLVNHVGVKTVKKLVVDEDRGLLLVFSPTERLQRQIPLTQLIQVRATAHCLCSNHAARTHSRTRTHTPRRRRHRRLQVERSTSDSGQVNLIFSSQGVPLEEEETLGGLEVLLRIKFSTDSRREEFLHMVLKTQAEMMREYTGTCFYNTSCAFAVA